MPNSSEKQLTITEYHRMLRQCELIAPGHETVVDPHERFMQELLNALDAIFPMICLGSTELGTSNEWFDFRDYIISQILKHPGACLQNRRRIRAFSRAMNGIHRFYKKQLN
jgi:hypothetical protein